MRRWRWYSKVLFALLVGALLGLFGYFEWPTPYSYATGYRGALVRTSRFRGTKEELCRGHWLQFIPAGQGMGSYSVGSSVRMRLLCGVIHRGRREVLLALPALRVLACT